MISDSLSAVLLSLVGAARCRTRIGSHFPGGDLRARGGGGDFAAYFFDCLM